MYVLKKGTKSINEQMDVYNIYIWNISHALSGIITFSFQIIRICGGFQNIILFKVIDKRSPSVFEY